MDVDANIIIPIAISIMSIYLFLQGTAGGLPWEAGSGSPQYMTFSLISLLGPPIICRCSEAWCLQIAHCLCLGLFPTLLTKHQALPEG